MQRHRDLTNQTFGDLVVIGRVENDECGRTQWVCKCVCGGAHLARSDNLRSGRTTRCPVCVSAKHSIRIEAWYHVAYDELRNQIECGFAVARKGDTIVLRTGWESAPRRRNSHSPILTRAVLDLVKCGHIRMQEPTQVNVRLWVKRNMAHMDIHSHNEGPAVWDAWQRYTGEVREA